MTMQEGEDWVNEDYCECCEAVGTDSCPVFDSDGCVMQMCFNCTSNNASVCLICGMFKTIECFETEDICMSCEAEAHVSDFSEDSDWEDIGR